MSNKNDQDSQTIQLHLNNNNKTLWVDQLTIAVRDDGLCLARMFTRLPEGNFEQFRFVTSEDKLKDFVKALCSATNYYPKKPPKE
ncbi:hypothetical protein [Desulfonatronovibrio magnus]|uniref:hypothetical protein n=1 Tax=Desulfonatronovibrio magnus TaxID=698827 RepID=UPI0005EAD441|nr:hypothetical protein [Desulfonatronovibrio magnus]